LTGVAKGAGCGVLRLGSGIVDVATFWVPGFNGLPVSDSYDNCLAVGASSGQKMGWMPPPEPFPAAPEPVISELPVILPSASQPPPPAPQPAEATWKK
jgi:hypothetical protein